MKRVLKWSLVILTGLLLITLIAAAVYLYGKRVQRSGNQLLTGLQAEVTVQYDERGVPHIEAKNEADLYRALGYVHAQDRLFQMEMVRRLAKGELAEILGPKLLDTDRLFRTLGLRKHAADYAARLDKNSAAVKALNAYLDGINQYQVTHAAPLEFELLGIPKRPFTIDDTVAVSGYMAYSFAAAFRTEPVLTQIRDKLGADYLRIFDLAWHPEGVIKPLQLGVTDWDKMNRIATTSQQALEEFGLPQFEGSNAWVVAGKNTASGKPLLAGDPHIAYSAPAVWYEAHLKMPGFELYGHHQALNPFALLGHNQNFGWTLTMFQNDDLDFIAEKVNPQNPNQVWIKGQWVDMQSREEIIKVKGRESLKLQLRTSAHGPIISDAFREAWGEDLTAKPIAMWWTFLETENPVLDAFYELNRASTKELAAHAASNIHAPGLNVVWANAQGDIAWWAAAKLVKRPTDVNPAFILDGSTAEADKPGFTDFADNPHEVNPARGYIVSANQQPLPSADFAIPGYYNLNERARRLDVLLSQPGIKWNTKNSQALQLDNKTAYAAQILPSILPILRKQVTDADGKRLLELLEKWDGSYQANSIAPTIFSQLLYQITYAAMANEVGEVQFKNLLRTRALDYALPRLLADANSPWWDNRATSAVETRDDILALAWRDSIAHLQKTFGTDSKQWTWGKAHTLTHKHPLSQQKPLDKLFNIGPFEVAGGREVPNNLSGPIGPAPWDVVYGPSTRRLIDFADASKALGINPVGQSGVLFDAHYNDQAAGFAAGTYVQQYLSEKDVVGHAKSVLVLRGK
ncbi:penicillin acylase family protein [Undibacterium sp. Di27W]|uniref:penicillin acylase family protein n=1 Tax=Undibacterium sp. Di27W TaxID=3413036 RepID=UPI003BF028F5